MTVVNFKGTDGQYKYLHKWVYKRLGAPKLCTSCLATEGLFEWANKSGNYLKDESDWVRLCRACHRKLDIKSYRNKRKATHCKNGHEFTDANTRIERNRGRLQEFVFVRRCLTCRREYERVA